MAHVKTLRLTFEQNDDNTVTVTNHTLNSDGVVKDLPPKNFPCMRDAFVGIISFMWRITTTIENKSGD